MTRATDKVRDFGTNYNAADSKVTPINDAGREIDSLDELLSPRNDKSFDLFLHTRMRYVHAARARALRKRGEHVHWSGWNSRRGRPIFVWVMTRESTMKAKA